jgi:hypothetical protein
VVLLLLLLLLLLLGRDRKLTALKVARQCPLVLLVKVGWRQGADLGSEEVDCWVCTAGGNLEQLGRILSLGGSIMMKL